MGWLEERRKRLPLKAQCKEIKRLKIERDEKRNLFKNLSSTEIEQLELELSEESKKESILLKKMTKYWNFQIENAQK